jgi:hypothetical protein
MNSQKNQTSRPNNNIQPQDPSPFTKKANTFVLYLEPILNTYFQAYQNVITISHIPDGPLSPLIYTINAAKLSPFQGASIYGSPFYNGNNCTHVILRYPAQEFSWKNSDIFMGKDDIPALFSFLLENGYHINTDITRMLFDSRIDMGGLADRRLSGDRKMIAVGGTTFPLQPPPLTYLF